MIVNEEVTKMNRRICVAIGEPTVESALAVAAKVQGADVIEIRLDYFKKVEIEPFIKNISSNLLFTCRPNWEGGLFEGAEEERLTILKNAVQAGADYVDIELEASAESQAQLDKVIEHSGDKTKKIVSNHDFIATSKLDHLVEIVDRMIEAKADIGKVITTAENSVDVLRVFNLIEYAKSRNFPLISFCMGKAGAVSRVASCDMGGYMTYCSADDQQTTAPGQLSVSGMRTIFSHY